MKALVFKDLRQNAKGILFFVSSAIIFPTLFYFLTSARRDNSGFVGVIFGFVTVSGPTLFGIWFIGQEKLKGTYRLLKILPISGVRVITAKSLTSLIICLLTMNLALIGTPAVLKLSGFTIALPPPSLLLWLHIADIFLISLSTLVFTAFNHKIAAQISMYTMMAIAMGGVFAEKMLAPRGYGFEQLLAFIENIPVMLYFSGMMILILSAGFIILAGRIFDRAEWSDLEEN
jgi:hypothetical protein